MKLDHLSEVLNVSGGERLPPPPGTTPLPPTPLTGPAPPPPRAAQGGGASPFLFLFLEVLYLFLGGLFLILPLGGL